ncbi:SAM-dependent methyltransferase [Curvibacter sp. HBC61]|uniref:Chemotaxis protein methyltransferase n=1 Tax=Curvibacter cyanobacteriorum TaxID=3026422 RepID=A0ABT5MVT1_9BURK|nr:CheR family methyltransferase [Curvibacter sp. HBC61]MDD0837396.1 SAM-dependent methyltransferase [Curvibacter sp. HBC61]
MPQLSDAAFQRISALMYDSVGLSFADHKKALMSSRLALRLQRLGLTRFEEYADLLEQEDEGAEFQMAVDLLTTNETYFFREARHFELLQKELLSKRPRPGLALWSAASSFGDEAFSLAMLLADLQAQGQVNSNWSILATDISHRVLTAAREGIYPETRLRFVSPERLRRYCLRGEGPAEGQAMVKPELRARVQFGQLNLTQPFSGLGPFDAVFLRNVLIYFDPPTKTAVVDRVLGTLKPGGLFFIGTAEGRVPCKTPLEPVSPGVFRKRA